MKQETANKENAKYIERMEKELVELERNYYLGKIGLETKVTNEKSKKLLSEQLVIMSQYIDVLKERIALEKSLA